MYNDNSDHALMLRAVVQREINEKINAFKNEKSVQINFATE